MKIISLDVPYQDSTYTTVTAVFQIVGSQIIFVTCVQEHFKGMCYMFCCSFLKWKVLELLALSIQTIRRKFCLTPLN